MKTPTSAGRPVRNQQERAIHTRAQILRTAAEMFADSGFRQTSLTTVAERAEITKGAVYFHFASKEALAIAVVEEQYSRWPNLVTEVRGLGLSPIETVTELLDRTAIAFRDDVIVRGGVRLQTERSLIEAQLPQPYTAWIGRMTALLEDADAAGQLRPGVTPEAGARVLVEGFFGMQHISDTLNGRADLMERWGEMREILMYAIAARP
jgi:AcrR family transcriptional regulator